MKEKIKCAVIGAGSMGRNHVRILSEMQDVELVAVVDEKADVAEKMAATHGCKWFTQTAKMIAEAKPDAAFVCVPTSLHLEVASELIRNGIHVLVEKPIAVNVEQGQKMLKLAAEHNVKLTVGHIERFNPAVIKVKEIIGHGEIGKVVSVMARRVGVFPPQIKDVNIAIDLAIHDIDIVNFLLGELPTKITADKRRNHIEHREDSVEIFMSYPSASAFIQSNWITPVKIRKLNITGMNGYLEMDYVTQQVLYFKSQFEKFREPPTHITADYVLKFMEPEIIEVAVEKKEPLREELKAFLNAIRKDEKLDAAYAIEALRIALEC